MTTEPHQPKQRGGKRLGAGRPKVYESAAQRQQAYRQRQQQQAQKHAQALEQLASSAALTLTQQRAVLAAAGWLRGKGVTNA